MQIKKLGLVLTGFTFLSTPAFALLSVPNGWYLEVNGGTAHLWNQSYGTNSTSKTSGIAGNANGGYKFIPYAAVEMGYTYYPITNVKDAAGTKAAVVSHYSYDLAARAILPMMNTGFESFAKLGVGRMNSSTSIKDAAAAAAIGISSTSAHATGIYWGLGVQYYFTPEMPLIFQFQRAQGNDSTGNGDLWSIGFSYIFV